jgi:hypothetical protein
VVGTDEALQELRSHDRCLNLTGERSESNVLSRIILVTASLHLSFGGLLAQGPSAPIRLSPLLGQPVPNPESLSGIWEAPDGRGGAVGLHLQLTTVVPADVTRLSGVTQSWFSLQVGVYQRNGPTIQFGEENFFVDSYPDSNIRDI